MSCQEVIKLAQKYLIKWSDSFSQIEGINDPYSDWEENNPVSDFIPKPIVQPITPKKEKMVVNPRSSFTGLTDPGAPAPEARDFANIFNKQLIRVRNQLASDINTLVLCNFMKIKGDKIIATNPDNQSLVNDLLRIDYLVNLIYHMPIADIYQMASKFNRFIIEHYRHIKVLYEELRDISGRILHGDKEIFAVDEWLSNFIEKDEYLKKQIQKNSFNDNIINKLIDKYSSLLIY